jgi:hypothetical protein
VDPAAPIAACVCRLLWRRLTKSSSYRRIAK